MGDINFNMKHKLDEKIFLNWLRVGSSDNWLQPVTVSKREPLQR